jgi:hypothetical protein
VQRKRAHSFLVKRQKLSIENRVEICNNEAEQNLYNNKAEQNLTCCEACIAKNGEVAESLFITKIETCPIVETCSGRSDVESVVPVISVHMSSLHNNENKQKAICLDRVEEAGIAKKGEVADNLLIKKIETCSGRSDVESAVPVISVHTSSLQNNENQQKAICLDRFEEIKKRFITWQILCRFENDLA